MTDTSARLLSGEPIPVCLMNTVWADRDEVHDALRTVADLHTWLSAIEDDETFGVCGERLGHGDVHAFRTLREALRNLAAFVTGDTRPGLGAAAGRIERDVAEVNHAVCRAGSWQQLTFHDGELHRQSARGATAAMRSLSAIATRAVDLFTGDDRVRLQACYAPGCVLYFVKDHPRRAWCSTACGNRVRAARHYRRRHTFPVAMPGNTL
jgi:predicted RNA-binding Zn ribbon-like protein